MESISTESLASPGVSEQISTRIAFFVAGFALAAWAPIIPFVKEAAKLSEGALGLLMLCLGTGSIIAMPLAGAAASHFGCRATILVAFFLVALALPVLAISTIVPVLAMALVVFGAGIGATDCVMNMQAVMIERASGKSMMSGFHGLFSVGGLVGAACVTFLLSAGLSPVLTTTGVVTTIVVLMSLAARGLLPYGSRAKGESTVFAIPRGMVLFLGTLCFIVFLAEGSILDWSAVFMAESRKMDPTRAGLGYVAFALTMTAGRLTGDAIVNRIGQTRILVFGAALAAVGLAIATFVPIWQAAIAGFALVGAGCSNIVPVLFTAAGRQKAMPEHLAVPAITTLGYAGVLAGPATIGFIAQTISLPAAFTVVATLLVGVAISGRFILTHRAMPEC
jgi:predicted MFS family arabinose efflux permease